MQFTPLGPWGVGASAGPATEGLKGDSGRVADPNPLREDTGWERGFKIERRVGKLDRRVGKARSPPQISCIDTRCRN